MPSQSDNPQLPQSISRTPRGPTPPPRPLPWRSLVLVTGMFLGFLAVLNGPREIGAWHRAAAEEFWTEAEMARLRKDSAREAEYRERAFTKLQEALSWSPGEVNWRLTRASWNFDSGKYEAALEEYNQLLRIFENNSGLLEQRMSALQKLGRHTEAVEVAQQLDVNSKNSGNPSRADAQNTVAYAKAVGNIDLNDALQRAEESVQSGQRLLAKYKKDDDAKVGLLTQLYRAFFGIENEMRDIYANQQLCMRLDTRGFVHYRLGNYVQALADLDPAAKDYEKLLLKEEILLNEHRRNQPDPRKIDLEIARKKEAAAVIFYHRSLALEKLGKSFRSLQDRRRVRHIIGKDPDETLF
jgi:hypothetical protein